MDKRAPSSWPCHGGFDLSRGWEYLKGRNNRSRCSAGREGWGVGRGGGGAAGKLRKEDREGLRIRWGWLRLCGVLSFSLWSSEFSNVSATGSFPKTGGEGAWFFPSPVLIQS